MSGSYLQVESKKFSWRFMILFLVAFVLGLPQGIAGAVTSDADALEQTTSQASCAVNLGGSQQIRKRALTDIPKLNFATYNVENLFYYVGKFLEVAPLQRQRQSDPRNKSDKAMRGVATAITDMDLDVAVLEEVEGEEAVQRFVHDYLNDLYDVHLIPGNDQRGINIAFITKKDLPFEFELITHKNDTWIDPTNPQAGPVPLFSRDVPVLKVFARGAENQRLHLLSIAGVHNKSKRDRPGDPMGRVTRGAQASREVEIWNELAAEMGGNARVIMAGDFNGVRGRDAELDVLNQINGIDALDANGLNKHPENRITHTYHPRGAPMDGSELDYILISPALRGIVNRSCVYRYRRNDSGLAWPIPKTQRERSMNPSDHFPKFMQIRFQEVVRQATLG